eukprot:105288_1
MDFWDEQAFTVALCGCFIIISLCCCLMGSTLAKGSKCLSSTAHTLVVISYLAEDLTALFLTETDFDSRILYWIFYGRAVVSAFILACGECSSKLSLALVIFVEITQSVLLMWTCSWSVASIIIFCAFCLCQALLEWTDYYSQTEVDPWSNLGTEPIALEIVLTVLVGIGVMPHIYYHEDSLWRSQWFGVYLTFVVWFSIYASGNLWARSKKNPPYHRLFWGFIVTVWFMNAMVFVILSSVYIKDALPGFEFWYSLCSIIGGVFGLCLLVLIYRWHSRTYMAGFDKHGYPVESVPHDL